MKKKVDVRGVPAPERAVGPSAVSPPHAPAHAAEDAAPVPNAPTHEPRFGDVFVSGGREAVFLRMVGDDLCMMSDDKGNRGYARVSMLIAKAQQP